MIRTEENQQEAVQVEALRNYLWYMCGLKTKAAPLICLSKLVEASEITQSANVSKDLPSGIQDSESRWLTGGSLQRFLNSNRTLLAIVHLLRLNQPQKEKVSQR